MKITSRFDLTQELRRIAARLQSEASPRPHRAASELEAFDLIQAEAVRLLVSAGVSRGITKGQTQQKWISSLRTEPRSAAKRRSV